MKNNKLIIILIVIILLGVGAFAYSILTAQTTIDKDGGVTTKKDAIIIQEISYGKDGMHFTFTKNRLTKTADVAIIYGIVDKDEYMDFLGENVTNAPFTVNLLCGLLNQAFFDPEGLQAATEEEQGKNPTQDKKFKENLGDYKVKQFTMQFIDQESKEKIATCKSTQKGFDNIAFSADRDYTGVSSMFGHQIGFIPTETNENE